MMMIIIIRCNCFTFRGQKEGIRRWWRWKEGQRWHDDHGFDDGKDDGSYWFRYRRSLGHEGSYGFRFSFDALLDCWTQETR